MCLVVLGLALFDCVADAGCVDAAPSEAGCHACSCFCGPRLVSPAATELAAEPASAPCASYRPSFYDYFLSAALFRPPRLAA